MKKVQAHRLLYGASLLMVLGFCVHLLIDYIQYSTTLNSAPFWVWILVDSMLWLIPAILCAVAGYISYKKLVRKEKSK